MKVMMNPTPEQQQALQSPVSTAVIASAGTGKTTVLTDRFLYILCEEKIPLQQILAFTFTENASREMKWRVLEKAKFSVDKLPLLQISTIHSFCHSLLVTHGYLLDFSSGFTVWEEHAFQIWCETEIQSELKTELADPHSPSFYFYKKFGYHHLVQTLKQWQSLTFESLKNLDPKLLNFFKWNQEFQKKLLQKRVLSKTLTYDDLEFFSLKLLKENPRLKQKLQNRYRHILVDEFQDVSPIQYELISELYDPNQNTLFIVGDPKQSIYGFRETSAVLFQKMQQQILKNNGKKFSLTTTFRTPQSVQDYFNSVFPHVLKTHDELDFESITTKSQQDVSHVLSSRVPDEKVPTSQMMAGQTQMAVLLIQNLLKSGTKPEGIVILSRTRRPFAKIEQELKNLGIPVITDSKTEHFKEDLIKLFFHILLYLSGNREKIHQVGILRHPLFHFSEEFIQELLRTKAEDLFLEATEKDLSGRKVEAGGSIYPGSPLGEQGVSRQDPFLRSNFSVAEIKIKNWFGLCHLLKQAQRFSTALTASKLFETVFQNLIKMDKTLATTTATYQKEQVSQILKSWEKQGCFFIGEMRTLLKMWEQSHTNFDPLETGQTGVHLLTIHKAKGLEFDHVILFPASSNRSESRVFLYDDTDGFVFKEHDLDNIQSLRHNLTETEAYKIKADEKKWEEQKELSRLIYVALTRTKKNLYLLPPAWSSQKAKQKFLKKPLDTSEINSYNNWLCWLALQQQVEPIEKILSLPPEKLMSALGSCPGGTHLVPQHADVTLHKMGNPPATPFLPLPIKSFSGETLAKPTLSVTQIENFFECPKKFDLKHNKNIYPLTKRPQKQPHGDVEKIPAETKGNVVHEVFQFFDPSRGNLKTVVERALFNQHVSDKQQMFYKEMQNLIQNLERHSELFQILYGKDDFLVEQEFFFESQNLFLTGKIDKLVNLGSKEKPHWLIIDYKTHKLASTKDKDILASFRIQMLSYALAVQKFSKQEGVEALIFFTETTETYRFSFDKKTLSQFEKEMNDKITSLLKHLETEDFPLTENRATCQNCPYYPVNYCGVRDSRRFSNTSSVVM